MSEETLSRCDWAKTSDLERDYHDQIWGKPLREEKQLFKRLILEGQQAGLSWLTILKKFDSLSAAYDNFDPEKLANYDQTKVQELLNNPGVIRNRLKVAAAISNAQAYLELIKTGITLSDYLWGWVENAPVVNSFTESTQIPARSELSDKISVDLKSKGFKFVGSTIIYAYIQSIGMVNDHLVNCSFRFS